MQIITLYKYERENGGITVSPIKPNVEYTEMYRLVADEGKVLTQNGVDITSCTDVESTDGWCEIDEPNEEANEADYQSALEDLGVKFDEENDIE